MAAVVGPVFDGIRPVTREFGVDGHTGVDFGCEPGIVCRSGVTGRVTRAGWGGGDLGTALGNAVEVWDPAQQVALAWCHLGDVGVAVGQQLGPVDVVGHTGASGCATFPNLHFMICRTAADGTRLETGNGFGGWLNPLDPSVVTWMAGGAAPVSPSVEAPAHVFEAVIAAAEPAPVRVAPVASAAVKRMAPAGDRVLVRATARDAREAMWLFLDEGGWVLAAQVSTPPPPGWSGEIPDPVRYPDVQPPPVDQSAHGVLSGPGHWESADVTDYAALMASGVRWIAIRATEGAGSSPATVHERRWRMRSVVARQAGLRTLGWTAWHTAAAGQGPDADAYLSGCAAYTAQLAFAMPGWIVDVDDIRAPGLAAALTSLRDVSGKPVYVSSTSAPDVADVSQLREAMEGIVLQAAGQTAVFVQTMADGGTTAGSKEVPMTSPGAAVSPAPATPPVRPAPAAPQAPAPAQPPSLLGQFTTMGPDGVEPGVFTTEFVTTQVTSLILAVLAVGAAFHLFEVSEDQRRAIIELAVVVVGALQTVYALGRSLRKGMAARQPPT